ncbi:MAG: NAD(P)/FAD-dependent oxidoreductase [Desulforegulaceae bacterium]|nr:NAD(P)/FAD-dependent oxidoreductase [Desulforegulaceae bacterium]
MKKNINIADIIIIGAGASGLMCALQASKRGKKVIILDHNKIAGAKILVSGGGKCNFTNKNLDPENYISTNPHFVKSALSRFSQNDFISMVEGHRIKYEERNLGQLFLKKSAKEILDLFLNELKKYKTQFFFETKINSVRKIKDFFIVKSDSGSFKSKSLVVASGGMAAPQIGASSIGYEIADNFGIDIIKPFPGLVPLAFSPEDKKKFSLLSGIAVNAIVKTNKISFKENILFTHKGISGPAGLQISLYLKPGNSLFIDFLPDKNIEGEIKKDNQSNKIVKNFISQFLPKNLVEAMIEKNLAAKRLKSLTAGDIVSILNTIHNLEIKPSGNLGFKKAETTIGGIDCNQISSKTMEALNVKGLYFTGEVLDVAGWLGGYNLQWAWSSGWCAGQYA